MIILCEVCGDTIDTDASDNIICSTCEKNESAVIEYDSIWNGRHEKLKRKQRKHRGGYEEHN